MDSELKAKWIEALRSGKFKQGSGALRVEDTFCCLGVLCEVGNLGKWERGKREADDGEFYESGEYDCHFNIGRVDEALLPVEVRQEIDLSDEHHKEVWSMNDHMGASFAQIADYIEKNL